MLPNAQNAAFSQSKSISQLNCTVPSTFRPKDVSAGCSGYINLPTWIFASQRNGQHVLMASLLHSVSVHRTMHGLFINGTSLKTSAASSPPNLKSRISTFVHELHHFFGFKKNIQNHQRNHPETTRGPSATPPGTASARP